MIFEKFIAGRYLLSKKKIQFITIITFISIVGISVGVAALISVLSVFNGFNKFQVESLTGFDPHIRIEPSSGSQLPEYYGIISKLKDDPEVTGIAAFTLNKGVISSRKNNVVVYLKGVDDNKIAKVSDVVEETRIGEFKFSDNENFGGIVLGINAADRLQTRIGDTVTVMSTVGMERALTQIITPKTQRCIVRGIFDVRNRDYDKLYAFISLNFSQRLFDLGNSVNGVEIRLRDINDSEDFKEKLVKMLGSQYTINTWYNLHQELYTVMQAEKRTAYIVLCLIITVATFNIAGSLTMTVIEKKRDIGILKAMGSTNSSIIRIFMFEGILIGIYGAILGCIMGLGVCFLQIKFKLFPLDPLVYPIDALPVDLRWGDFVFVALAALFLSFAASLYPALRAARQEPIQAIRWE
jgi:lipoprotein-releasing system permease protein